MRPLRTLRRVGIDVGCTFTDLVAVDQHGRFHQAKHPSTPWAPSKALQAVLTDLGETGQRFDVAILGTTVATNSSWLWTVPAHQIEHCAALILEEAVTPR